MTRYLLDSGIVGDLINRRGLVPARVKAERLEGNQIGLGTPVPGELIAGMKMSNDPERHLTVLKRRISELSLWSFDKAAAVKYGQVSSELRRIGRPMQAPDMQIAAIALSLPNCVVVTKDGDLKAVRGLRVEDWSRPNDRGPLAAPL